MRAMKSENLVKLPLIICSSFLTAAIILTFIQLNSVHGGGVNKFDSAGTDEQDDLGDDPSSEPSPEKIKNKTIDCLPVHKFIMDAAEISLCAYVDQEFLIFKSYDVQDIYPPWSYRGLYGPNEWHKIDVGLFNAHFSAKSMHADFTQGHVEDDVHDFTPPRLPTNMELPFPTMSMTIETTESVNGTMDNDPVDQNPFEEDWNDDGPVDKESAVQIKSFVDYLPVQKFPAAAARAIFDNSTIIEDTDFATMATKKSRRMPKVPIRLVDRSKKTTKKGKGKPKPKPTQTTKTSKPKSTTNESSQQKTTQNPQKSTTKKNSQNKTTQNPEKSTTKKNSQNKTTQNPQKSTNKNSQKKTTQNPQRTSKKNSRTKPTTSKLTKTKLTTTITTEPTTTELITSTTEEPMTSTTKPAKTWKPPVKEKERPKKGLQVYYGPMPSFMKFDSLLTHNFCDGPQPSPINIDTATVKTLDSLTEFEFTNLDHDYSVRIYFPEDGTNLLTVRIEDAWGTQKAPCISKGSIIGPDLCFDRFFIHYGTDAKVGSEHQLNGNSFSMEFQFFFTKQEKKLRSVREFFYVRLNDYHVKSSSIKKKNIKGKYVRALSVFVQVDDNMRESEPSMRILAELAQLFWRPDADRRVRSYATVDKVFKFKSFFPQSVYYAYKGSLTFPPCFPDLDWAIFEEPIKISRQDFEAFLFIPSEFDDTGYVAGNLRPMDSIYVQLEDRKVNKDEGSREQAVRNRKNRQIFKSLPPQDMSKEQQYDYYEEQSGAMSSILTFPCEIVLFLSVVLSSGIPAV